MANEDGTYLLYNTFSGSLAHIDSEDDETIGKALAGQPLTPDNEELIADLREALILRPQTADENHEIREWYDAVRVNTHQMNLTLLTTNACNMACAYCFEGEALKGTHMPEPVAKAVVQWAERKLGLLKPSELFVRFFGGEPFINPKGVLALAREFHRITTIQNVRLRMAATTNGTRLSRELIEELTRLGLESVKVTLDGDEERHNEKRPLKNGQNGFQTIWKNLESIQNLVQFDINVNAEPKDAPSIGRLLPVLSQSSFRPAIRSLKIQPLRRINPELGDHDLRMTPEVASTVRMWQETAHLGGYQPASPLDGSPCEIHRGSHFTVDPKGDLYPCAQLIGRPSARIGSIFTDEIAPENAESFLFFRRHDPLNHPKCSVCSYFPICGGGCRAATFTLDRNQAETFNCPVNLLDLTVPAAIREQYKTTLSSSSETNQQKENV
ncbi:MAG TPA: radical SAM protein [Bdellovibrionota bacterium]|nr:radical SAM protein [Bdellovibrionota bacterium]